MLGSLRLALAAALACSATLLLGACGKDAASSTSSGSAPATAAPHPAGTAPAPAATTAAPAGGGACTFTGMWAGNYPPGPYPFSGMPYEFTFHADGTGMTDSARAKQEWAWKTEGNTFTIHGTKLERGGHFTCANTEVGKFSYQFTPDCTSVTFKLKEDPCKGRGRTMDGATMKRK